MLRRAEGIPANPRGKVRTKEGRPSPLARGRITSVELKKIASHVPGEWIWDGGAGGEGGIAFSPDSQRFALPLWGECKVLDLATGKQSAWIDCTDKPVLGKVTCFPGGVAIGADGNIILSRVDQMICVFDKTKGKKVKEFEPRPHVDMFHTLWYSKQGNCVIGRGKARIVVWEYPSGKQLNQYDAHEVVAMDVSPNGQYAVTIDKNISFAFFMRRVAAASKLARPHEKTR